MKQRKEIAGFWRRYGAYVIDGLILGVVWAIFYFVIMIMFFGIMIASSDGSSENVYSSLLSLFLSLGICMLDIAILIVYLLYFTWFESSNYQGTPGKIAVGMQVVDLQGNRISFGKALIRNLLKIVSFLMLGLGFIIIAFTEKGQGLHDMIAGTTVVMKQTKYL